MTFFCKKHALRAQMMPFGKSSALGTKLTTKMRICSTPRQKSLYKTYV